MAFTDPEYEPFGYDIAQVLCQESTIHVDSDSTDDIEQTDRGKILDVYYKG